MAFIGPRWAWEHALDGWKRCRRLRTRLAALAGGLALSACALQPPYQAPQTAIATRWQAELPHGASVASLVDWWSRFNDPAVAELIRRAEADSPTLAKAVAQINSARATLVSNGADAWPALTGSASVTRAKSATATGDTAVSSLSTTRSGALDASWEIDLFGKVRASRQSAQAQLEARIDDWHDARVSLAAEVADDYVQYRACRQLAKAYAQSAASRAQTAKATRAAVAAGMSAASDGYLADGSTASANATATQQSVACETLVKSLVALTGTDEPTLRGIIDRPGAPDLPQPDTFSVTSVPADLVRQRPDLASAERALAAAYASIAKARADRFPRLSLSGSIAVSATSLVAPMSNWSFGPSLSLPLFDAGQRKAAVDSAQASYDAQLATYRSAVRTAVKEVEQALVDLDGAARRSDDARQAAEQYRRYVGAIETNWRAGLDTLLTLEEARRSATTAEITLIELQRDRVRDWVSLYKALGGGWQAERALAATPHATPQATAVPAQGTTP
ncbi:efflux transporter outer membrane subunit [Ralstonia solanacearum]|uniref:efflux transporter outer membrane subunit n=1 Tax=Ralstonia solanacearum TaxID=305 RepID=UPI001FF8AA13|nr:efflux transporter outer membrane subunit [Ralstonia solanacearum]MDB0527230.1 efflux transporter outer membrane subunit [Ralstonia solanacearum]